MMRCFSLSLLFLAVVLLAPGCGDSPAKVKGTVQLDGKPLADAGVQFWPKEESKLTLYGKTDSEGRYRLMSREGELVKPGRYAVVVIKDVDKQGKVPDYTEQDARMKYAAPGMLHNILPPVYADRNKSPLSAEVKPGDNEIPLDLKGRAGGGAVAPAAPK